MGGVVHKKSLVLKVILVVGVGLVGACSAEGELRREEVVAKLVADPRTKDAPKRVVDCVADWYMEYASPEQVRAFLDGGELGQVGGGERGREVITGCLRGAADNG
ncbi:hypothetical protein [Actinokineospora diospyrosa]|uniref:Lipoprotein n=1 Tax=Actinokineospora diospyrosa TaxID=103728 RepID=A0ABT1I5K6_9PSEU|nr:hypothetical protein [Actinokineospora diospyrosa]MCP2267912.1 hypothetical protein [Actinokineospora diospyrosa]